MTSCNLDTKQFFIDNFRDIIRFTKGQKFIINEYYIPDIINECVSKDDMATYREKYSFYCVIRI